MEFNLRVKPIPTKGNNVFSARVSYIKGGVQLVHEV